MVADVLAAIHLATLVGQHTGLAPSGPGQAQLIKVPGSPFTVQVSTTSFEAPGHPATTSLTPQISVPLTLADVRAGINPISRWLAFLGQAKG